MTDLDRPALRRALLAAYSWLAETDVGPQAVEAGECDRCGHRPRLLPTCGPVPWPALCRACARELGSDAWCDGHAEEAVRCLAWAAALPPEWTAVVRWWWVATGEVRLADAGPGPAAVAALVPRGARPSPPVDAT